MLDADEATGSQVRCLSLIRDRAAFGPDVMSVLRRSWPTLVPEQPIELRFRHLLESFDLSMAIHFRSPSRISSDAVTAAPFDSTFTTTTLNRRSLS